MNQKYSWSEKVAEVNGSDGVFYCAEPVKRSGLIWLIPLIFSAVWLAVLVGVLIKVVLPELDIPVNAKAVIGCAVLLWLVLVVCVRRSVKRINPVVRMAWEGTAFSVLLSDQTCHRYATSEITLCVHQVRGVGGTDPVRNNHFRVDVKSGRKTVHYDVRVTDDTQFLAWISALPCCRKA